jgi:uridylate kinase
VEPLARELAAVAAAGIQVALVVGGGNFLRGASTVGLPRAVADSMGMLATVMNGLALQDRLEHHGVAARMLSAIPCGSLAEPFSRSRCLRHLGKGRVVVLAGGTGNPFFTTDTAAALRASEIGADCLLKGTQVDGVYSADPKRDPAARRYDSLTYQEAIEKNLGVMDTAAIVLCRDGGIPIVVFDLHQPGNLGKACRGESLGTIVRAG